MTNLQPLELCIIIIILEEKRLAVLALAVTKKKGLSRKDGPFIRDLYAALASFKVHCQAYYSDTFVGNHVHRALLSSSNTISFTMLFSSGGECEDTLAVPELTHARCPQLLPKAQYVSTTYVMIFSCLWQVPLGIL